MKKYYLFTITLAALFITSCSNKKLIKKTVETKFNYVNKFYYEKDKLIKYFTQSSSNTLTHFEYGDNGKIKKVYTKSLYPNDIKDLEAILINQIENLEFGYEYDSNNRVHKVKRTNGKTKKTITYDSNGRINKITSYDWNGNIDEIIFSDYDDNGNAQKVTKNNYTWTITYDDKINIRYILFIDFGLFDLDLFDSLGYFLDDFKGYVSPNNPISIKDESIGNRIVYSAILNYDTSDYPIQKEYYFSRPSGRKYNDVELYKY